MCQGFGSDLHPDPKRRSENVANSKCGALNTVNYHNILWGLWLWRQDALYRSSFGVPLIWASHMTVTQGGSKISTWMEDFAGSSAVFTMLSEVLGIELWNIAAENATQQAESLLQAIQIVIGGVPTILEGCFMCLFISLCRIQLQGSASRNLVDPMSPQVHLPTGQGGIKHIRHFYLMADIIPPGIQVGPFLGRRPRFTICILIYLLLLHNSVRREMALAFALLQAHLSKKTSL